MKYQLTETEEISGIIRNFSYMLVFILTYGIVNKKNKNILVFIMPKETGNLFWLQSYSSYGGQGRFKTNSLESGSR